MFSAFSVQPWSALPRAVRPDRPRTGEGCMRVLKLLRALGPRKNEAEKWPSLRSQPPDNSIVRRRVDAQRRFLHENLELVVPCLPIPFTDSSAVNYSRDALKRIYTARSWRSSRINRPKWMHCTRTRFCLDFSKRKKKDSQQEAEAFLINNDEPLSIL